MDQDFVLPILAILGVALLIFFIVFIVRKVKHGRSICKKCKKEYSYPESFNIVVGDLTWEKRTREETKGDFKYEIEYKHYYRKIRIELTCTGCGAKRVLHKTIGIYDSDSKYPYNEEDDRMWVEDGIKGMFDKKLFAGKDLNLDM